VRTERTISLSFAASRSRCPETLPWCKRPSIMSAKKYRRSLRPRPSTPRRKKTSQSLCTRKSQSNQLPHLSRRRPRLLERHRPLTNRRVRLCHWQRLPKHHRPYIKAANCRERRSRSVRRDDRRGWSAEDVACDARRQGDLPPLQRSDRQRQRPPPFQRQNHRDTVLAILSRRGPTAARSNRASSPCCNRPQAQRSKR
jgi:hypothetical protein